MDTIKCANDASKRTVATTGDGEGGGGKREDYSEEDVEYYFNYSGILAERGSYDSMEELLTCKCSWASESAHPQAMHAILLMNVHTMSATLHCIALHC